MTENCMNTEQRESGAGDADRDTFSLEPEAAAPAVPRFPGENVGSHSRDDALAALAADLFVHAKNCVRTFGDVHMALSGTNDAQDLYRLLMTDPVYRQFPWNRSHIWIAHQAEATTTQPETTSDILHDLLVIPSGVKANSFHPYDVSLLDDCGSYERSLRQHLAWRERGQDRLDFVLANPAWLMQIAHLQESMIGPDSHALYAVLDSGLSITEHALKGARLIGVQGFRDSVETTELQTQIESSSSHLVQHLHSSQATTLRWYWS